MEKISFCQSCGMPINQPDILGTEYDGSHNPDYCKYCYKEGSFTVPAMTLAEMQSNVSERLNNEELPSDIIDTAVSRLSSLKRWQSIHKDADTKRGQEV